MNVFAKPRGRNKISGDAFARLVSYISSKTAEALREKKQSESLFGFTYNLEQDSAGVLVLTVTLRVL